MNNSKVKWLSPVEYWFDENQIRKPQILQFSSDSFMEDFITKLQDRPSDIITEFKAMKETWRGLFDDKLPLKLYQPAHMRHYLLTASLVCQIPGLPDRRVDTSRQESVSFVIRRLIPNKESGEEYALILNSGAYAWTKVVGEGQRTLPYVLVPGEELLPMFAINYNHTTEHRRRIWAGTIPVGKREIYENTIRKIIPENDESKTNDKNEKTKAQKALFLNDVITPWESLMLSAVAMASLTTAEKLDDEEPSLDELKEQLKDCRDQIQVASWYILLDFARYLDKYLNNIWKKIKNKNLDILPVNSKQKLLYDYLWSIKITEDIKDIKSELKKGTGLECSDNLCDALSGVWQKEMTLDQLTKPYTRGIDVDDEWPNLLFPLADPRGTEGNILTNLDLEKLIENIENALTEVGPTESAPEIPLAAQLSEKGDFEAGGGLYTIRCVYQRPNCPLPNALLSERTVLFNMASFFDADAPARPIRITLPENPTPAGLRKYAKNTAFIMSDVLCGQMAAIRKVTFGDLVRSVLPWPFHKSLSAKIGKIKSCKEINNSNGSICSLSIPIVTICAMFLLIMIVLVLDFIFKWVPFLISCFKIPIKKS